MKVFVGDVENNINDQSYICTKCGKECKWANDVKQEAISNINLETGFIGIVNIRKSIKRESED
jgi:hypothetical protein